MLVPETFSQTTSIAKDKAVQAIFLFVFFGNFDGMPVHPAGEGDAWQVRFEEQERVRRSSLPFGRIPGTPGFAKTIATLLGRQQSGERQPRSAR